MRRLLTTLILGGFMLALAACGEDDQDEDGPDDPGSEEIPEDPSVDEGTIDTLTSIIDTVDRAYRDWEGRMLVNTAVVDDPGSGDGSRDIESRVHIDAAGERFYIETLDVSDSGNPETLHYLYVEDGVAYSYESAERGDGEDSGDRYVKMDKETVEDRLPDIDVMFDQTFQYFPSDESSAEMQGMTLLEASVDFDEDETAYEADVNVLMQDGTGEQKEKVWSLSGDEREVTVEMPVPTLGTVTFREIDFDEAVDGIDKDRHTRDEDDGSSDMVPDGESSQ